MATLWPWPKVCSNENLNKIAVSLGDFIKLNGEEGRKHNFPGLNRRIQQSVADKSECEAGGEPNRVLVLLSLDHGGRPVPGKRCPFGVITGPAARKATGLRKGVSPMNHPPVSD